MNLASTRRSIRLDGYDYATDGAYFITICTQHKEHRFGHIADGVMMLNTAGTMISERIQAIPAKFSGTLIDSFVVMPNHIHFILSLLGYQKIDKSIPDGSHVGAAPRGRPLSDRQGRDNTLAHDGDNNSSGITHIDSDWLGISGPIGPKAGGHEGPPLQINDLAEGNATNANDLAEGNATNANDLANGNENNSNGPTDGNVPDQNHNVPSVANVVGWFKASTTNYYIKGVKAGTYPAFDRRLWQRNYHEHIIRTEAAYNQIDEYIRANPQRWGEDRLR